MSKWYWLNQTPGRTYVKGVFSQVKVSGRTYSERVLVKNICPAGPICQARPSLYKRHIPIHISVRPNLYQRYILFHSGIPAVVIS